MIILRAGDYFGPTVRNGLVDPLFENAVLGKPLRAIGKLDIPHQWAFVPDLARAALDLLDVSKRLNAFEVVHFSGYVPPTQRDFLKLIAQQAGSPDLAFRAVPWPALKVAAVLDSVIRELMELRYLFDSSVILDGSKLKRLLPGFRETPSRRPSSRLLRATAKQRSLPRPHKSARRLPFLALVILQPPYAVTRRRAKPSTDKVSHRFPFPVSTHLEDDGLNSRLLVCKRGSKMHHDVLAVRSARQ